LVSPDLPTCVPNLCPPTCRTSPTCPDLAGADGAAGVLRRAVGLGG